MKSFIDYLSEAHNLSTQEGIIADGIERLTKAYTKHGGDGLYQLYGRSWSAVDKIEDGIISRLQKLGLSHKDAHEIVFYKIRPVANKNHKH